MRSHQLLALVAHHLDQRHFAEHATKRRVEQRRELKIGGLDRADALIELQRVLDAIAREGIDHEPLLVRGDHFLRRIFQIEDAFVDRDHGVDERRLEMQARIGDDIDRAAEPHDQRLFGLLHGKDRAVADDQRQQQQQQKDNACDGGSHREPPVPCCCG